MTEIELRPSTWVQGQNNNPRGTAPRVRSAGRGKTDIVRAQLEDQIFQIRKENPKISLRNISAIVGVPKSTVALILEEALAAVRVQNVTEWREIENDQIAWLWESNVEDLTSPNRNVRMAARNFAVKLLNRRAKLNGYDATPGTTEYDPATDPITRLLSQVITKTVPGEIDHEEADRD